MELAEAAHQDTGVVDPRRVLVCVRRAKVVAVQAHHRWMVALPEVRIRVIDHGRVAWVKEGEGEMPVAERTGSSLKAAGVTVQLEAHGEGLRLGSVRRFALHVLRVDSGGRCGVGRGDAEGAIVRGEVAAAGARLGEEVVATHCKDLLGAYLEGCGEDRLEQARLGRVVDDDVARMGHLLDVRVTQVVGVRVPHHALSRPADAVVRGVDEIVLPRKRWHRATHARERLE
mmetsp:Transcript_15298/g.46626  ORF Transcript_15298/g.46626 Transcript_15298/m.46626 type:complete len:229 (-) Transcript_15298:271-957(-)